MKQVFKNTKIDGTFATFTSASNVQKNLTLAGFKVFKKKGFKKKREMKRYISHIGGSTPIQTDVSNKGCCFVVV